MSHPPPPHTHTPGSRVLLGFIPIRMFYTRHHGDEETADWYLQWHNSDFTSITWRSIIPFVPLLTLFHQNWCHNCLFFMQSCLWTQNRWIRGSDAEHLPFTAYIFINIAKPYIYIFQFYIWIWIISFSNNKTVQLLPFLLGGAISKLNAASLLFSSFCTCSALSFYYSWCVYRYWCYL